MKKDIKYIWVVETQNTHIDGTKGGKTQSFFSTEEKTRLHVEWLCACSENNNATCIVWDDTTLSAEYKLTNGDTWVIKTERKALDLDDLFIGEC